MPSSTMLLALRAGSAKAIFVKVPTPSVLADSVAVLESVDTLRITVPAAMWPPLSVSTIGRPRSPALNAAVIDVKVTVPPVVPPSRNEANPASLLVSTNAIPPAGERMLGETVTLVRLSTARITVLAAMWPPPSVSAMGWPRSASVKFAEPEVKVLVPLVAPSVKLAGGVTRLGSAKTIAAPAAAAADSVTVVALTNVAMVVPATIRPRLSISKIGWPASELTNVAVAEVNVVVPLPTPSA